MPADPQRPVYTEEWLAEYCRRTGQRNPLVRRPGPEPERESPKPEPKRGRRDQPEAREQQTLFRWAELEQGNHPELRYLFAIPNGGSRHKIEAARLKGQGVKAGVSDIFLPVARSGYHGLWIELKRKQGGRLEPEQRDWLVAMTEQGYQALRCNGFDEAREAILKYLDARCER